MTSKVKRVFDSMNRERASLAEEPVVITISKT